ncbi:hypothetical protein EV182_002559, partial [Spiromyces aspiralis]
MVYSSSITGVPPVPVVDIGTYLIDQAKHTAFGVDPDRVVVVDSITGHNFTFAQFEERALGVASGLQNKLGVKPGDLIGVFLPNT